MKTSLGESYNIPGLTDGIKISVRCGKRHPGKFRTLTVQLRGVAKKKGGAIGPVFIVERGARTIEILSEKKHFFKFLNEYWPSGLLTYSSVLGETKVNRRIESGI